MDESTPIQGYIQDLMLMHDMMSSTWYLFKGPKGRAGHHAGDSLEAYIHEYPDSSFLHLFRMHRESFWQLVQLLTREGGNAYWCQANADIPRIGQPAMPIYQQIAIALYVLGGGMTEEKCQMLFNVGYRSIWGYTWRTIDLLTRISSDHIQWPERGRTTPIPHPIFQRCIGFLDGSSIVLRDRPKIDTEAYFSRKKNYGFN